MKMSEAEKAFEFDRAKEALAREGRTGGLVYEIIRLVRTSTDVIPDLLAQQHGQSVRVDYRPFCNPAIIATVENVSPRVRVRWPSGAHEDVVASSLRRA